MLFGLCDVIDLMVFNKKGKLLAKLESIKENDLNYSQYSNENYLLIKDALLNTDILEVLGNKESENKNDYEKELSMESNTICFGSKKNVDCKLIGIGYLKETTNGMNVKFKFEIPKAEMVNKLQIKSTCDYNDGSSDFDYVFKIYPFNDEGDLFKLHIDN